MAILRVNQGSSAPATATTMTVTLPTLTAGNFAVLGILANNNSLTISSIADTAGNGTFLTAVGPTAIATTVGTGTMWIMYKENVAGIASTDTFTITFSGATGGGEVAVAQYSGVATSASLDQHPVGNGSATAGTTATTSSFNPTQSTELAITWTGTSGGTPTAGTNYTNVVQPDTFTVLCERISPPTGAQTATTTFTSNKWEIQVATFLAAAAGTTPKYGTPRLLMGMGT
jgi:hypothetical protein